jgi:uncharacterized protein Usg
MLKFLFGSFNMNIHYSNRIHMNFTFCNNFVCTVQYRILLYGTSVFVESREHVYVFIHYMLVQDRSYNKFQLYVWSLYRLAVLHPSYRTYITYFSKSGRYLKHSFKSYCTILLITTLRLHFVSSINVVQQPRLVG